MSDACYCDYDERPDVYHAKIMGARTKHKCYECGGGIVPGQRYERAAMLYGGSWEVAKTCGLCLEAREYIKAHAPCFCWAHGSMLDDAKDTVNEYGHESAGFYIGAMKRVLRAERHQPATREHGA